MTIGGERSSNDMISRDARRQRYRFVVLAAALAVVTVAPNAAPPQAATDVDVTGVWPTATPESQGLDSGVLADMLEHVRARQLPLHSVLIVRHGRLVLDTTLYPFQPDRLHDIASA